MKKHLTHVALLILGLLSVFGALPLTSSITNASSRFGNPLVIIAKDVTASSQCQTTERLNIGTPQMKVIQFNCSPGTIIDTATVPLAAAKEHHWAYVILSSAHLSYRVDALIQSTRVAINKALKRQMSVPTTACGGHNEQDDSWHPNFDPYATLKSKVFWLRDNNPFCYELYIGSVEIELYNSSVYAYWYNFNYNGYPLPEGCRYINHNSYVVDTYNQYNSINHGPQWSYSGRNSCSSLETFTGANLN